MLVIKKNAIKCKLCNDIIESKSVHDFVTCSCGNVSVDGGHEYLRRCFRYNQDDYEELSETYEVPDSEVNEQPTWEELWEQYKDLYNTMG